MTTWTANHSNREKGDRPGRFLPRKRGGPTRLPRATEVAYLQRLVSKVDLDTFQQIIRVVAE